MSMAEGQAGGDLDLRACEREPIHIPGAIQEHGMLLALDADMCISMAAGHTDAFLGGNTPIVGRPLRDLFDPTALELAKVGDSGLAQYAGVIDLHGTSYDALAHRSGGFLLLELEPAAGLQPAGAVLQELLTLSSAIAMATDLSAACEAAAQGIRQVTAYDRVMIYRFLEDGSGQVISEARSPTIESFLNHRYPASDIPPQARMLYVKNPIRVIPDVAYRPAPIRNERGPLDLGGAMLRSVSPVHIQYLKNMGVGASASVSIIQNGELWGLIACHHRSARFIPHERREMCRHLALALESAIGRVEEDSSHREALRLTRRREELLPVMAAADSVEDGLAMNAEELQRLIPSDGLALLLGKALILKGVTPSEAAVRELASWLMRPAAPAVFATTQLGEHVPAAAEWAAQASGVLSICVSRNPAQILLWFRAEEVETVNWAGNPHKPHEGIVAGKLSPRSSFALWAETVRGRSRAWRPNEQEAAHQLAKRLEGVGRHIGLGQMNRHLSDTVVKGEEALAEKDLLVREVHHRVQNNLQLVTSMLKLQEREVEDEGARRQLDLARDRIQSIATLHRRLWRSDDLQVVNLETFFAELTDELIKAWGEGWRDQVELEVAPLRVPGHNALLLGLVVTEVLTNAFKHAYSGEVGPVRLAVRERGSSHVAVVVADSGVGGGGEAKPGSFGSRLIQRLIQQIDGELEVAPNNPGTCVTLVIPRTA
jgi:light-regulated signal transduction histidine kinase (bacteriophytochrome)